MECLLVTGLQQPLQTAHLNRRSRLGDNCNFDSEDCAIVLPDGELLCVSARSGGEASTILVSFAASFIALTLFVCNHHRREQSIWAFQWAPPQLKRCDVTKGNRWSEINRQLWLDDVIATYSDLNLNADAIIPNECGNMSLEVWGCILRGAIKEIYTDQLSRMMVTIKNDWQNGEKSTRCHLPHNLWYITGSNNDLWLNWTDVQLSIWEKIAG